MTRRSGEKVEIPLTCRLDTSAEVEVYNAGGILQKFAKDVIAGQ
jgi:aconitate hydratase